MATPLELTWKEDVVLRKPLDSNEMLPTPIVSTTDPTLTSSTITIAPFTASTKTEYYVIVVAALLDKTGNSSYVVKVDVLKSLITGYIEGGSRI